LIKQDVSFSYETSPRGGELAVGTNQTANASPTSTTVPGVTSSSAPTTINEGYTTPVLVGSIVGGVIGGILLGFVLSRYAFTGRSGYSGVPRTH
jgi:hypothetical protein